MYNKGRFESSARSPRQASDVIRYNILYQYGGVYLDLDFEPLKSIEPLLHGVEAFVVHENKDFVCNGIYGAIPGHSLSELLVLQLEPNWRMHENGTVNQQTGPYHITKQVNDLKTRNKTGMKNRFQTFAPHVFFPYAWFEKNPGPPYDEHSYTVHHFRPFEEIEKNGRDRT
jgi:mannosyltransferase OCH1-like enzyme